MGKRFPCEELAKKLRPLGDPVLLCRISCLCSPLLCFWCKPRRPGQTSGYVDSRHDDLHPLCLFHSFVVLQLLAQLRQNRDHYNDRHLGAMDYCRCFYQCCSQARSHVQGSLGEPWNYIVLGRVLRHANSDGRAYLALQANTITNCIPSIQ